MPLLQWTPDLAVGVEKIDDQHKELFQRINQLLEACNQGRGKEALTQVMDFLGDYIVLHFSDEEALQRQHKYPDYAAHRALHEKFVADYRLLYGQLAADGATARLVIQLNRVVVDWLVQHINKVDKVMAAYVRSH